MFSKRIAATGCAAGTVVYGTMLYLVSSFVTSPAGADLAPPTSIDLTGIVRDFRELTEDGGHPDFEVRPEHGFGLYQGNIGPYLSDARKPVFLGTGKKVRRQWRDSQNRNICYRLYDPALGDTPGQFGADDQGGIQSAETFDLWYHDVPGVNQSKLLKLRLHRQEDGTYVFDDTTDLTYEALGGFFPVEDQLLGNPGGLPDRNFHFTFELHCQFTYIQGEHQVFRFIGDDDVWVFVDNRLVIDLGGVHGAKEQFVELDRLDLASGEVYTLDFFFAERHRTQSNFRIVTNIPLESTPPSTITAIWD